MRIIQMRENLLHAEETGESADVNAIAEQGLVCTTAMRAELSGAYMRWEIQMLNASNQSLKLEEEFALLKPHIDTSDRESAETDSDLFAPDDADKSSSLNSDAFTPDEHRSFLDRCLRSVQGKSSSDS
jgi:hypothetical protein